MGTPKSSILVGFSLINQRFFGVQPIERNPHITMTVIDMSTLLHWADLLLEAFQAICCFRDFGINLFGSGLAKTLKAKKAVEIA